MLKKHDIDFCLDTSIIKSKSKTFLSYEQKVALCREYETPSANISSLAIKYNVGCTTVSRILNSFGIPTNTEFQRNKRKAIHEESIKHANSEEALKERVRKHKDTFNSILTMWDEGVNIDTISANIRKPIYNVADYICENRHFSKKIESLITYVTTNLLGTSYESSKEYLRRMLDIKPRACDICGEVESLTIDHCHVSGAIRGYLCYCCNSGLGLLKDNTDYMESAILYLKYPL